MSLDELFTATVKRQALNSGKHQEICSCGVAEFVLCLVKLRLTREQRGGKAAD